jgi:CheY-like chemotaxis protein/signal transduction histidine kinase
MDFYANLKIGSKLAIGYVVVVVFCCLVGFFGIRGMSEIKARLDDMHGNLIPSITTADSIDHHCQQHRRNFLNFLLETGTASRKEIEAKLDKEVRDSTEALEQFGKYPLLTDERRQFDEVVAAHKAYLGASAALQRKISPGGLVNAGLKSEDQQLYVLFNNLEALVKKLAQFNVDEADEHFKQSNTTYSRLRFWLLVLIICSILGAVAMAIKITRSIVLPLRAVLDAILQQQEGGLKKAQLVEAISNGDLDQDVPIAEPLKIAVERIGRDETGMLLKAIIGMSDVFCSLDQAFAKMTGSLRQNRAQEADYREQQDRYRDEEALRDWFKNGQNELNTILRGDKSTAEVAGQALTFLAEYLGAGVGVFYIADDKGETLQIGASYAFTRRKRLNERLALGEGLAGQAAQERKMICLNAAPPDYLPISSALGEAEPVNIVVLPLLHNDTLAGILELGSFKIFSNNDLEFLNQSMAGIAIALSVNKSRQRVNELLEETQSQSEELRVQQEELQQTNEELEERAQTLEQQREQIRAKNREVEEASREVRRKADELERVSTYKSEFLANMSHELRTPLNSLMILSSLLKDNREGNLTDKQVEFAATINGAGRDLLTLINDILDLSKIESGHLEFYYEELTLGEICEPLATLFQPVAGEKGIAFSVTVDASAPATISADGQRTMQILKNLLSNACKFTGKGAVALRAYTPENGENPLKIPTVAFAVSDTGIGIAADKQSLIFNAFQQADGSTSRTYGGTGLGLSISRQLARTMGGEISVISEAGQGSTFTLYLPVGGDNKAAPQSVPAMHVNPVPPLVKECTPAPDKSLDPLPAPIPDDRDLIQSGGKSILIIEDDLTFAGILVDMVRQRGFAMLAAAEGESGIILAERYQPSAIILDVMLPHIDGWGVMRSLKDNPKTRHIPVHFITCLEERQKAMGMGAIGYATKPVSTEQLDSVFGTLESAIEKSMKKLLIVEDDPVQVQAMVSLLEERNVTIRVADRGVKAVELLGQEQFDCIVLDLGLQDMGAFELLEQLKKLDPDHCIPVIIHTGHELTHEDEKRLHHYAESIIIKGAKSPERLLNEVTLFLHLVESSLAPDKQRMIRAALDKEAMLEGKKVLIVDDDMRNIFSLTSALEEKNIIVFEAENGCEALLCLDEHPDIDLVLMDIMMPEMDGYEASRCIRKDPRFHALPIIALTAKAMKGDREECLNAGASDYISKPVDMKKLFSLLRVWLYSAATAETVDMG